MRTSHPCRRMNRILAGLGVLAVVATGASADSGGASNDILAVPTISIDGASRSEGNSGMKSFEFDVRLSSSSSQTVKVDFTTMDGSATTANSDYVFTSGTLTIPPGRTSGDIVVKVIGDLTIEPDEQFFVKLSNPVNATIANNSGTGKIKNDDGLVPKLSIDDVSRYEGNSGTKAFTFTISLSERKSTPVTVQFFTADGTAKVSDSDYVPVSGTLTILANTKSAMMTVFVKGDRRRESDETFFVNLANAVGATISDNQGKGTIRNDDGIRDRDDDDDSLKPELVVLTRPTVYPNPARGDASLAFATTRMGPVRVELLDVAGRLVRTLADGSDMDAGVHNFTIGRESGGGSRLNPGIYFYRVHSPDTITTGRLVILE